MPNKDEIVSQILVYLTEKISNGHFPSYTELQNKFNLRKFHLKLSDLYPLVKVNYLNLKTKRPNNSAFELKRDLINYLKDEVKNGNYPTRRFIEKKFKLRFKGFSISDLYYEAGLDYKPKLNQNFKLVKAKLLQDLVKNLLPKLDLALLKERKVHEKGVDLLTENKCKELVGIEIKANHESEAIKKGTYNQIINFIRNENLSKVILITTTLKKDPLFSNQSKIIEVLDYNSLKELCNSKQIELLDYIRTKSIDYNPDNYLVKRNLILDYAREKIEIGKDITYQSILSDLHLHLYTYFRTIFEIYEALNLMPPLKKTKKGDQFREIILSQMVDYVKNESINGHYPTGKEISAKFNCPNIWAYTTVSDLYKKSLID